MLYRKLSNCHHEIGRFHFRYSRLDSQPLYHQNLLSHKQLKAAKSLMETKDIGNPFYLNSYITFKM